MLGYLALLSSAAYDPGNHGSESIHHHEMPLLFRLIQAVYIDGKFYVSFYLTFYIPLELLFNVGHKLC